MAAIIFDFDGTIVDSRQYFIEYIAKKAKQFPLSQEQTIKLEGSPLLSVARKLGFSWWQLPTLYFEGRRQMDRVIGQLEPFNDMPVIIKKLHNEGHELFIVSSNSVHNIRIFLKKHGLRQYFMEVYGGIELFGKATMLHRLLRENHLKVNQAVSVGDEVRDIQAAKSVGMRTVAVCWGFSKLEDLKRLNPTAVATNRQELLTILEQV